MKEKIFAFFSAPRANQACALPCSQMAHLNNLLSVVDRKLLNKEIVDFPVPILVDSDYQDVNFGREMKKLNFQLDQTTNYLSEYLFIYVVLRIHERINRVF